MDSREFANVYGARQLCQEKGIYTKEQGGGGSGFNPLPAQYLLFWFRIEIKFIDLYQTIFTFDINQIKHINST